MARTNYNSTATAGASKEVAPANARRQVFFFKSKGDVFVLNFGASATASNVLTVGSNEFIEITNNDPYDIKEAINVYCANASGFEAQDKTQ